MHFAASTSATDRQHVRVSRPASVVTRSATAGRVTRRRAVDFAVASRRAIGGCSIWPLAIARMGKVKMGTSGLVKGQLAKYGIDPKNIYSYENYEAIRDNPEIHAVNINLPNSMHAEFTIRGQLQSA